MGRDGNGGVGGGGDGGCKLLEDITSASAWVRAGVTGGRPVVQGRRGVETDETERTDGRSVVAEKAAKFVRVEVGAEG